MQCNSKVNDKTEKDYITIYNNLNQQLLTCLLFFLDFFFLIVGD